MMASTTMVHLKAKTGDGDHEANTMASGEALPSGMKGGSYDGVASAANPLAAEEAYVSATPAQPLTSESPLETPGLRWPGYLSGIPGNDPLPDLLRLKAGLPRVRGTVRQEARWLRNPRSR